MITLPEIRARHRAELDAHRAAAKTREYEIRKRHVNDLRLLLTTLAGRRITQTEASRLLGVRLGAFNQLLSRNDVFWPVKRQGAKDIPRGTAE